VKAFGIVLLTLGAFVTFAVASSYHAWRVFGIIIMIAGLVAFAAGSVPNE
jgi:small-conductance mechanosensitive channel